MKVDKKRYLHFFKKLAVILLVANLTSQTFSATFTNKLTTPNIIVIYTDDQGYGDATCLNKNSNSRHRISIGWHRKEFFSLMVTARIRCAHHHVMDS